jgi:putative glutamine amidotransferase
MNAAMIPRIAIPLPTSFDLEYNRLNASAYADAVRKSGGEPIEISLALTERELTQIARTCDGILLPGSPADVDPATYGQMRDEATAVADPLREATDRLLLAEAWQVQKPVFGICFGTQMSNVSRGGTLVQDLGVQPVNHAAGRSVAIAHTAAIAPGSLLARLVGTSEIMEIDSYLRLPVNSSHHQAVGIVATDLRVSARCPQDAVVEAIEAVGEGFLLGVQWHPERTFHSSPSSRALFHGFIAAAANWRAGVLAESTVPA